MLYIKPDGTIQLTRGDTAEFSVELKYDDGIEKYSVKPDDKLTLTIKKNTKEAEPLVQKVVEGTTAIEIEPIDTKHLAFGKYKYDVQLDTASGKTYTVIDTSVFEILEEVG